MVLTPPSEGGEGRCLNPRLAPWATLCRSFGAEFLNELLTQDTGIVLEMRGPLDSVARIPRSFKLTNYFADCLFVFRRDVPPIWLMDLLRLKLVDLALAGVTAGLFPFSAKAR